MFEYDPFDQLQRNCIMLRVLHLSLIGFMLVMSIAVAPRAEVHSSAEVALPGLNADRLGMQHSDASNLAFFEAN